MKNSNLIYILLFSFIFAEDIDVLHLWNGDIIKGRIIENKINEHIKIELEGGSILTFDYSNTHTISGDIFISIDRVKENAVLFENTFYEELHRVMVHGILHLLGYKDQNKKQKLLIREKENFYLSLQT